MSVWGTRRGFPRRPHLVIVAEDRFSRSRWDAGSCTPSVCSPRRRWPVRPSDRPRSRVPAARSPAGRSEPGGLRKTQGDHRAGLRADPHSTGKTCTSTRPGPGPERVEPARRLPQPHEALRSVEHRASRRPPPEPEAGVGLLRVSVASSPYCRGDRRIPVRPQPSDRRRQNPGRATRLRSDVPLATLGLVTRTRAEGLPERPVVTAPPAGQLATLR